jgi:hypothetical protein
VDDILQNIQESITMLEASTSLESVLALIRRPGQDSKAAIDNHRSQCHGAGIAEVPVIFFMIKEISVISS